MRSINDYLETARRRQGLRSLRKLSVLLGKGETAVLQYRNGRGPLPSQETMVRLAELAHVNREEALADLEIWRARRLEARALRTLERARKTLASVGAAAFIAAVVAAVPNEGRTNQQPPPQAVYYGKFLRWLRRLAPAAV